MSDSSPGNTGGSITELQALTTIVQALSGFTPDTQRRVLEAVLILVGGVPRTGASRASAAAPAPPATSATAVESGAPGSPLDIRQLAEQKRPESANEMAAIVAFYLSEIAAPNERADIVDTADMDKYFKQARFKLPTNPKMTLVHAKNAGYFDAVGGGRYKLNPVGYNLVAYTLPRAGGDSGRQGGTLRRARRHARKATRKITTKARKK